MKNGIRIADSIVELTGTALFVALYLTGAIGIGYAVLGVVVSLSIWLPFNPTNKSTIH